MPSPQPQLISTLIPFAALSAKLRIQNVGHGPALQITARIQLQPSSEEPTLWCQPAMVSGAFEDFLLPDLGCSAQLPSFRQLAEQYDRLVVHLEWFNIFSRKRNTMYEIDLKQQVQGWYSAHRLIQPEELPEQLAAIQEELKGIKEELQKPNRALEHAETMKHYRTSRSLLYRFRKQSRAVIQRFHTAISSKRE